MSATRKPGWQGLSAAAKIFVFASSALAALIAGALGAQALWQATHHRYDSPNSGYYYGYVDADFLGLGDDYYSFRFKGRSASHWRWRYSTNFAYSKLEFTWYGLNDRAYSSNDSGTLLLPSCAYESSNGKGVLTRDILANWLLGTTNSKPSTMRGVDALFGFIEAAGNGSLPAPRHHGYHFEQSIRGRIQHFELGFGVGCFVYIWIGAWLLSVLIVGRKLQCRSAS